MSALPTMRCDRSRLRFCALLGVAGLVPAKRWDSQTTLRENDHKMLSDDEDTFMVLQTAERRVLIENERGKRVLVDLDSAVVTPTPYKAILTR